MHSLHTDHTEQIKKLANNLKWWPQNLSTHILYFQEKKKLTSGCKVHYILLSINKEMVLARLHELLQMWQQFSKKFQ